MAETARNRHVKGGFNLQVSPEIRGPMEAFLDTIPLWEVWGCCLKFDHNEILLMLIKKSPKNNQRLDGSTFLNLEQIMGRFQLRLFPQLVFHGRTLLKLPIGSVAPTGQQKGSKVTEEILFAERFCWGDLWNEKAYIRKNIQIPKGSMGLVYLPTFGWYHPWILWDMRSK